MVKKWLTFSAFIIALSFPLVACGGGLAETGELPSDPQAGEELFNTNLEKEPGKHACSECHTLTGTQFFAPTIQGISDSAAERVEGMSAEQYLRQSIVDPKAYIVGSFPTDMPTVYGEILTEKQINDVIAFMLTQ